MAFNLFEVVKYEGNRDVFAWMYDNPNVKKNTTVVVGANQIAFWVSNGIVVEVLGPGKHKLDGNYTQGLSWIVSQFHGGKVPSSGEVWFISTGLRNLRWGTPNRISVNLNYFNAFRTTAKIAANGNIQLKLETRLDEAGEPDAQQLWNFIQDAREAYGDDRSVTVDGVHRLVTERVLQSIQAGMAEALQQVDYGDHYAQLPRLAEYLRRSAIQPQLDDTGLVVRSFQILALEGDQESQEQFRQWWGRLTEADVAKYEKIRAAEAERFGIEQVGFGTAESRRAQGFTFQEERQFEVLEKGAGNAGIGGDFMSAGVGLAMGSQMGNVMGGMFTQAAADAEASRENEPDIPPPATTGIFVANDLGGTTTSPVPERKAADPEQKFCLHCGTRIAAEARFCPSCGGAQ